MPRFHGHAFRFRAGDVVFHVRGSVGHLRVQLPPGNEEHLSTGRGAPGRGTVSGLRMLSMFVFRMNSPLARRKATFSAVCSKMGCA